MGLSINREIIRLTFPSILTNITVPVLGLCDTGISGHLGDGRYIGAISIGAMMINVLFWLCGFLRMGTTGLTAQEFGKGDYDAIRRVFTRAFLLALVIGSGVVMCCVPLCNLMITLIGAEPEVREFAELYFYICILGTPAQLTAMTVSGWFLGMQDTVRPMIISISTNIINLALSFTFVFGLETGFKGVALGTLTANWLGLGIALILACKFAKGHGLWCKWSEIFKDGSLNRFFKVNSDLFFRSAFVMGVSLTVTAVGARIGWLTLSTNAVMMQFFILFSYFMDGFAFCGEALSGRFLGEKNRSLLLKSIRYLLVWAGAMSVTFLIVYLIGWKGIVEILTNEHAVIESVTKYHIWLIMIPPVTVAAFIFDGFFIGMTATRRMLIVTALSATIFFLTAFVHLSNGDLILSLPNNNTLWTSFLIYLFCRGAFLAIQTPYILKTNFINYDNVCSGKD
ncbi:MAG: MATE family efflux transporter [Prevotella sp.]|nr:MATE family efflux transporter [Bacteroides sp.]MCM1366290.1 MATE family efflux transporter [Prevotella sp.]MCM1437094.1 MATE family efflux transporter [Prevotella sp.]